jgi:hypothetical protein
LGRETRIVGSEYNVQILGGQTRKTPKVFNPKWLSVRNQFYQPLSVVADAVLGGTTSVGPGHRFRAVGRRRLEDNGVMRAYVGPCYCGPNAGTPRIVG